MDINSYAVDIEKEQNGSWIEIDDDGTELLIARMNNPAYKREIERLKAPYRKQIRKDELSEEKSAEILAKAMAKTILLGWRGLTINGQEHPYTYENALHLLTDPKYKEFLSHVIMLSNDIENFRNEEIKKMGKDSAPTSDGALSGVDSANS